MDLYNNLHFEQKNIYIILILQEIQDILSTALYYKGLDIWVEELAIPTLYI